MMTMGRREVIMVAMVIERTLVCLPLATLPIAAALAPDCIIFSRNEASLMILSSTEVMGLSSCLVT